MNDIAADSANFELIKKNYLSIHRKYEHKIDEMSILKEMVGSMKSIDLGGLDLIWHQQLDCLIQYKNLSGVVLFLNEYQNTKEGRFFSVGFDAQTDYATYFRNTKILETLVQEKTTILLESTEGHEEIGMLEGAMYGLPMVSGDESIGALILLKNKPGGFHRDEFHFYSIVNDHLMNIVAFRRFYFQKIAEERHILQLSRFFSKEVVKKILDSSTPQLGGERKNVCVSFVDLQGFTSISELLKPEQVLKELNDFFSFMIPKVFENHGTLDKLMGDCIMAIFGAPIDDEQACYNGVKTALEMFVLFDEYKRSRGRYYKHLKMTVGINFGELVAGFIGEQNHLNYTVIGDTVNASQRLQSMAKGNQIYISESVFNEIKPHIDKLGNIKRIDALGTLALKGKSKKINAYRIIPELC